MQWPLLYLLPLVFWLPAGRPCLQCAPRIRLLHEDFLLSAAPGDVKLQIALQKIVKQAYVTYRETSQSLEGVIDPTTLYRASTEYQSEFNRFQNTEHKEPLTIETILIVEKGRKILKKHLETFVQTGLCPNRCGLLYQKVMNCTSCQYKLHTCPSPTLQTDCGEFSVQVEEGGQAVLDCRLPWHSLVVGGAEYRYSWSPSLTGAANLTEANFSVLVVTEDSSVVLNQLQLSEQGTYRCLLLDRNGTALSQMYFLLTVIPSPSSTLRPLITLPSLPPTEDPPTQDLFTKLLVPILSLATVLCLIASIVLVVSFGLTMRRRGQGLEEEEEEEEEEEQTESRV